MIGAIPTFCGIVLFAALGSTRLGAEESGLEREIDSAIRYMLNHCDENGRFVYLVSDIPVESRPGFHPDEYNQVRHAGALYALSPAHAGTRPEKTSFRAEIEQTLKRGARYMLRRIGPVPGVEEALAVWSPENELDSAGGRERDEAKLGSTGLALVALCYLERIEPGFTSLPTLRRLGRFLRHMTLSDGSTIGSLDSEGRVRRIVSAFYPGEAALGLCALHRLDPEGPWLETARAILLYLARTGQGFERGSTDHWIPIAAEDYILLLPADTSWSGHSEIRLLNEHVSKIVETMLEEQITESGNRLAGAFEQDGSLCPGAARLEGLLAAWKLLPDDEYRSLKERIFRSAESGIRFLAQHQIQTGTEAGGIPQAAGPLPIPEDPIQAAAVMNFNRFVRDVRIDTVQHFLSAAIRFAEVR